MMPEPTRLLAFAAASIVLVATPGPNLLYILTRSVDQGRRAGLVSAAGVETGTLVHVTAAALGLSGLVAASPVTFAAVRYAGAAYLLYLGIRALLRPPGGDASASVGPLPLWRVYRDGVLVNVLNPKVGLFPPGAAARPQLLVLGAMFFALALALDVAYTMAGGALSTQLRHRPGARRWQRLVVGGVYLSLGGYAALARGP